jgi:uncharacterized delta-60 repeat protein
MIKSQRTKNGMLRLGCGAVMALAFALVVLVFGGPSYAALEGLDTATFNPPNGSINIPYQGWSSDNSSSVLPDGKILVRTSEVFHRVNQDGTLDSTYGVNGELSIGSNYSNYAVGKNGEVVVLYSTDGQYNLKRYDSNGSLDTSFGNNGVLYLPYGSGYYDWHPTYILAVQPDGKIINVISQQNWVTYCYGGGWGSVYGAKRYNTDGSLDTSFGTNGTLGLGDWRPYFGSNGFVMRPDGGIIAYGSTYGNCKYTMLGISKDGSLDTSFGDSGKVTIDSSNINLYRMALQPDGKIITYVYDNGYYLERYNSDGSVDTTFGTDGKASLGNNYLCLDSIAFQSDGKIITGCTWSYIKRYNKDGSFDTSFGVNGSVSFIGSVAVQSDDKILAFDNYRNLIRIAGVTLGINSLSCPESLYQGQSGDCSADVAISKSGLTLQYKWDMTGGTVSNDVNKPSATIKPSKEGQQTVTLDAYVKEYPEVFLKKTVAVNVLKNVPTISKLTCPTGLLKGQKGQCTAEVSCPWGDISYSWSANNGKIEGQGNTVDVSFSAAGSQAVTLTTSIAGSSETDSKTAKVYVQGITHPALKVTGPKSIIKKQKAEYTATASSQIGAVDVSWSVNGVEYQGNSVQVVYDAIGTYEVVAKATILDYKDDPDATTITTMKTYVTDMPKPTVMITAAKSAEQGIPVTLTAKVTSQYTPVVGYWTLPDGSTINGEAIEYTPTENDIGKQSFKYTAYVDGYPDAKAEATQTITVWAYKFPEFTLTSHQKTNEGYAPYFVYFSADADFKGINHTFSYAWDFGDGTVVDGKRIVTHIYNTPGTYTVALKVDDGVGNISTHNATVKVTEAPPLVIDSFKTVASNKYNKAPLTIVTRPIVTGGNPKADRISSYQWKIDGQPVEKAYSVLAYRFDTPGTHNIEVTASTKEGKTAAGVLNITVNENQPPECDINYVDYPQYKYTKITPACTDPDGRINEYAWDLGDGSTSRSGVVYAKYTASGTYTVTLTAKDDSGGITEVSRNISVSR